MKITSFSHNYEFFIQGMIMKRNFGGNRVTTKVFFLFSHKMTNEAANVALATLLTSVFIHNIGFQVGRHFEREGKLKLQETLD